MLNLRWTRRRSALSTSLALLSFGCSGESGTQSQPRAEGQSDFSSAAPSSGNRDGNFGPGGLTATEDAATPTVPSAGSSAAPRTVEETDLYRLEGDRLYYLNAYRGLMVFDVSNVDAPRFLGRSPIYGYPEQMIVRSGVATVVVSDWYGKMDDGTPFHGSIVRGIDARDPSHMAILGEAQLGGVVRDTRVVGDVIYAVTEKYPWYYGWLNEGGDTATTSNTSQVNVASVSFAGGVIQKKDEYNAAGADGVFYVTADAILLGHQVYGAPDQNGYAQPTGTTALDYIDISDPGGKIKLRGSVSFEGYISGWGTDNGRWNIDFADQKTAHALACGRNYCGSGENLVLASADFSDPDQPSLLSRATIAGNTWSPAVRFDAGRMYLSPSNGYYSGSGKQPSTTPIQIYDLANASAPRLAGTLNVSGQIWNFTPSGNRLFALGSSYSSGVDNYGSRVDLHYLDVTNPAAPVALGTASFGQGWAWTPAAGTFKAFAKDDAQGLVVLPFSGYDYHAYQYNNGLQLIEFTPTTIATSGAAHTRGWVERGIFVKNRLVSLSNVSLAVVDYTSHAEPKVVSELTLARNVVNVMPQAGGTLAELSSDFWDNDQSSSELRVLEAANVEETTKDATLASLSLPGINARVYHDGTLSYVESQVNRRGPCVDTAGKPLPNTQGVSECSFWHTRVQVVDRSGVTPRLRGVADLPETTSYWGWGWGWGFWGCYMWDWYYGAQTVQVAGHILAFQSYTPPSDGSANWTQTLVTVNLADPDRPVVGRTPIVDQTNWWWGNLRAVGDQLYVSHYAWETDGFFDNAKNVYVPGTGRYYVDRIDLSSPENPVVTARINVPGILVGASESNPNLIYTIDYRWYGDSGANELAVSLLEGNKAYYQGGVAIPGYVGNVFVRGSRAYFSAEQTSHDPVTGVYSTTRNLYQANLEDPKNPTLFSSTPSQGWGWMLDVQGDRAFVQSGWGSDGLDVYKLNADRAPTFEQTVRVRGWYTGALARQGNDVYLATGYWGTEHVTLR